MISHCANSECGAPFHYLRGGRLYRFEVPSQPKPYDEFPNAICNLRPPRVTVFFWLCEQCSTRFTLKFNAKRGLVLLPLSPGTRRSRTAPVIVQTDDEGSRDIPAGIVHEGRTLSCPACRPAAARER